VRKTNLRWLISGLAGATLTASLAVTPSSVLAAQKKLPKLASKATKTRVVGKKPSASSLRWTQCDGPVECADLRVPLDASNPAGPTTRIAIGRIKALNPAKRRGVLVVNPGGPGGSAIDLVRSISDDRSEGRGDGFDDYDVIGVDPRGVGRSDRISCGGRLSDIGINPFAPEVANANRAVVRSTWLASCRIQNDLVLHAGTIDAANDINSVRLALGETQIDYLGYSYGTVIGAVLAAQHGPTIRSMVLDAAVDPSMYGSAAFITSSAAGKERRVSDFAATCAASTLCALRAPGRETPEAIAAFVAQALQGLEAKAPPGTVIQIRSTVYGLLEESANWVNAALYVKTLDEAVTSTMTVPPQSATLLFQLLSGDPAYWAANCTDQAFPTTSAVYETALTNVKSSSPIVGSMMLYLADLCVDWPAQRPLGSLRSNVAKPILVVGASRDTRTPIEWSQGLAANLGNAVLITRDGDGHTSYPRSICIRNSVNAYLQSNIVPANGQICN
jgi:pimeloyl-ACP methyl ester carboxylesterase